MYKRQVESGVRQMLLPILAVLLQGAIVATPVLVVEVNVFILKATNEVALFSATQGLWEDEEWGLVGVLVAWVWVAPFLRAVLSLWLRMGRGGRLCQRAALRLGEWNMLAVFGLGLVVVWVKLIELTSTCLLYTSPSPRD